MTGLSMDSKRDFSGYVPWVGPTPPSCSHEEMAALRSFWQSWELKPVLVSPPIWLQRQFWAVLLQAMLLAIGCLYGLTSLYAEYLYADGFGNRYVVSAVSDLRDAAEIFPLNYQFRKGSAQYLTAVAVGQKNPEWTKAALAEIYAAIEADPTSADLLNSMRVFELELNQKPTHVEMYDWLSRNRGVK